MKTVNLDITHKCTLQCSGCNRQIKDYRYERREITLSEFEKVCEYFEKIILCGQVSDPIFHNDFESILKMAFEKDVFLEVHTAASHRSEYQYEQFFKANPNAKWYFGIDGLPQDSHNYRIGQDGEHVFSMMMLAKDMGLNVVWQYIVFDYNEDDLFEAAIQAKGYGVNFNVVKSYRGKQEGDVYDFQPLCLQGKKEIGHSTSGYLLPCCWSDYYQDQIPELTQKHLSIECVNSIEQILSSHEWNGFKERLKNDPPEYCKMYCGYKKNNEHMEINFE